jgi:hypothetical protein
MRALMSVVASTALMFAAACGGSASGTAATPTADADATPGVRAGAGLSGFGGGERAPLGMVITIDSCTWEPREAGGPVQLNVAFSVLNLESVQRYARYRVQNSTGTIFRDTGSRSDSSITVKGGDTVSRTFHTTKFPVGSQDLSLVFTDAGRKSLTVPLDQCTQP